MKKENYLNEIYEKIETLNHFQIGTLLNIHSLYITNDNRKVPFRSGMTLEEWVHQRIAKTTYKKDCPTVLKLIEMIESNIDFGKLENYCESLCYDIK